VPDADPGPVEQPEFFQQVLDDGAHSAARKAAKRPWWLPAGDTRNYVRTGWLYSIAAAVLFAVSLLGASAVAAWMLGGFWLLMGVWHFLSAAAVRRGIGTAPPAGDH
jgi:hypothetical protein